MCGLKMTDSRKSEKSSEEWFNRGNDFISLGKVNEALKCFKKAFEIDPSLAEAHLNYAIILFKTSSSRHSEAEEHFKKALELKPEMGLIHKNYALFLFQKGQDRYVEAEKHFKKALESEPTNTELLWAYGYLLSKMEPERYPEAEKYLKKALEINPKDGPSWEVLGWLYLLMERLEDSIDCLMMAYTLSDQLPDKGKDIFSELPSLANKLTIKFQEYISGFGSDKEKCNTCFRLASIYKILGDEEQVIIWCREGKKYCKDFPEMKQKLDIMQKI